MQWKKPLLIGLSIPTIMLVSSTLADQSKKNPVQMQTTQQKQMLHTHQTLPFSIFKASNIMGADVENTQGEELGEIKDVVIDPAHGSIAYAVLEAGGFLGLGEKYYAVPWHAFQPKVENDGEVDAFILDVNKERLQNAMGFDKENWPNMADPQWREAIRAHYSQQDDRHERQTMRQGGHHPMTSESTQMSRSQNDQQGVSATVQNVRGNTVELQVPQGLVDDLQTGDRVEVNVQKHNATQPTKSHQWQEKQEREEFKK